MSKIKSLLVGLAAVAVAGMIAGPAMAKKRTKVVAEPSLIDEIDEADVLDVQRSIYDLARDIRDRPIDRDRFDTAVVFTSTRLGGVRVICAAIDGNGIVIGAARTVVPGNGVRYLLASDISHGRDFIGSIICKAAGRVIGSIVLIGDDLTDLEVRQRGTQKWTFLRFPLVASF